MFSVFSLMWRIWSVDRFFFSVSVLREMLRCFSHTFWGGYCIYLFHVQGHFLSTTFVFKRQKSSWWFSFFWINGIFEHPLLWMTTNAFALLLRMDPIRHRFPLKGNKLHWYHRHGLVSLSCWFSSTQENQHIPRQKEQSQNISTCQVE